MQAQWENRTSAIGSADEEKRPLERDLGDLRKEIIESRNLVIKNDNLLKSLFSELKQVSKKAEDQYRRTLFASAAAYGIFFGLSVAVAILAARLSVSSEKSRVESAQLESDQAKKRAEDAASQLAKLKQEQETAKAASDKALAVYKLLSEGSGEHRMKAVDDLAKLDRSRLSALDQKVLDDKAKALKGELAQNAYDRGRNAYYRRDWKTAVSELRRYLTLDPEGSEVLNATYLAGTAAYELKDWEGTIGLLEKFIARGKGQKNASYAALLLGQSHEQLGHFQRAADVYQRAAADFPNSDFSGALQQHYRAAMRAGSQTPSGSAAPGNTSAPNTNAAPANGASGANAGGNAPAR